jgi:diguanylate cyclase (GGDEF)-like protein
VWPLLPALPAPRCCWRRRHRAAAGAAGTAVSNPGPAGRYAEEIDQNRSGSPFDELTGLCNLLGLRLVSSYALALCRRNRTPALLMCIDLDDLDEVEGRLGGEAVHALVRESAQLLADSFRKADILARVAPTRFVALLVEYTDDPASAVGHLERAAKERLERDGGLAELRMSIGTALFDPSWPAEIDDLIEAASAQMTQPGEIAPTE